MRKTKLKIEKHIQDDHQARVIVEVDDERLEASKRRAARQLAERGKIPGFRPGKAPYDVVRRQYGDAAIYEQAVDLLMDEIYPEVLKEADLQPAAAGALEKIEGANTPKFTFLVPLAPTVELADYRSIRLPYQFKAPGKDRLNEALEEMRQMYGTTQTVERAAQEGDYMLVDLKSEKDSLNRNGMATLASQQDKDEEWPFPGFAHELIGLKAGESKKLTHQFPAEHNDKSLAGQSVELEVAVKTVRVVTLPELDDDFAKTVGKFETLDQLKEALQKDLEARGKAEYENEYYAQLVDKIKESAIIKYPPQVLEHESEHVLEDLRQRLANQGLDLETYLKMRQMDMEKFMAEEVHPVAAKRLERSLILDEVSRREKIEVDNTALDAEFTNTLTELQMSGVDLNRIRGGRQGQQRVAEALAMESANRLLTRRTLARLKEFATGEYREEAKGGSKTTKAVKGTAPKKGKSTKPTASKKPSAGGKSATAKKSSIKN